jgi:hypothetical protein
MGLSSVLGPRSSKRRTRDCSGSWDREVSTADGKEVISCPISSSSAWKPKHTRERKSKSGQPKTTEAIWGPLLDMATGRSQKRRDGREHWLCNLTMEVFNAKHMVSRDHPIPEVMPA